MDSIYLIIWIVYHLSLCGFWSFEIVRLQGWVRFISMLLNTLFSCTSVAVILLIALPDIYIYLDYFTLVVDVGVVGVEVSNPVAPSEPLGEVPLKQEPGLKNTPKKVAGDPPYTVGAPQIIFGIVCFCFVVYNILDFM
jgi:hypothetical protein